MPYHKIWSTRVNVGSVTEFVGDHGKLFYDEDERIFRLSDGKTPGGIPLASFQVSEKVYPLSGKEFMLNFTNEQIDTLINFFIIDSNGEEISLDTKKTDSYLLVKSNIDLDEHFLFITYV